MTQVQAINSTDCLAKNLAALREFQPDVAKLVEIADISPHVERAIGRDGSETFRVPDESGNMRWMGATSMPSISAAEVFGNVRRDQGNVLLPGVLSGREPLLVAERLAPYAAVFVIEPSATLLHFALTLCDYRDVIRSGRMVFLCGDALTETMTRFFEAHPGYEYPGHLFHAPHATPADGAALRESVERAGEAVLHHHASLIERLQDQIAAQYKDRSSKPTDWNSPRVSLLSVEANDASVKSVSRIANALRSQGWDYNICLPDTPQRCHAVARLQPIAEASPDIVFFVNSTPKHSRALLPRSLPVVSWYLPGFVPIGLSGEHACPNDLYVTSTPLHEQAICRARLTCLRVAPATDASVFTLPAADSQTPEETTIAVLMDLPQDSAATMNLTLPSQVALWEAMREETQAAVELVTTVSDSSILRKAEKRSGTALSDASLRETFEELIATVLRPAARARACVESLREAERRVTVFGSGWDRENLPESAIGGPIPDSADLCKIFQHAQTVVFPVASDTAIQSALDALATGAHVMIGASDEAISSAYPSLCDVFKFIATYDTTNELASLLPNADAPRQVDAASFVASKHSFSSRLRQVVSHVQAVVESTRASVS